jgi:hypothetical protein
VPPTGASRHPKRDHEFDKLREYRLRAGCKVVIGFRVAVTSLPWSCPSRSYGRMVGLTIELDPRGLERFSPQCVSQTSSTQKTFARRITAGGATQSASWGRLLKVSCKSRSIPDALASGHSECGFLAPSCPWEPDLSFWIICFDVDLSSGAGQSFARALSEQSGRDLEP